MTETNNPQPEPDLCDHVGEERATRTAHGYLGDAPAGTVQTLCVACGTVLASQAPGEPPTTSSPGVPELTLDAALADELRAWMAANRWDDPQVRAAGEALAAYEAGTAQVELVAGEATPWAPERVALVEAAIAGGLTAGQAQAAQAAAVRAFGDPETPAAWTAFLACRDYVQAIRRGATVLDVEARP